MTNIDIIKYVYALDECGHYTKDTIQTPEDCPDWLLAEIILHHKPGLMYLLWSKYYGTVYKPERFERYFK